MRIMYRKSVTVISQQNYNETFFVSVYILAFLLFYSLLLFFKKFQCK